MVNIKARVANLTSYKLKNLLLLVITNYKSTTNDSVNGTRYQAKVEIDYLSCLFIPISCYLADGS